MGSSSRVSSRCLVSALSAFALACAPSPASSPSSPGDDTPQAAQSSPAESATATAPSEPSGPIPPDFELDNLKGGSLRLSDHLGNKVVLIDFWATFCAPCLAAMPHLQQLHERYERDGLLVLGVSIDGPDSIAQVRGEVSKLGITFPILLDRETSVVQLYNPKTSAPYSVLIGRDGRIIKKKEGYSTGDGTGLDEDVAAALRQ